jgi:hypothetical protein
MFFPHTQDIVKPYPRKTKVSLRNYPDQNSKCPGEMNSSSSIPNGSCKLRNKLACTQHTFLTTTFPLPSLFLFHLLLLLFFFLLLILFLLLLLPTYLLSLSLIFSLNINTGIGTGEL